MKAILRIVLLAGLAAGTAWAQTPAPGNITVVAKQMNVPFEGRFKKFTSQIQFDPAKPAAAKATIDVDMTSLDLGDEEFNREMQRKIWFDSQTYPSARFTSSSIKALGSDRFEATGKLSVKGKTVDVTVPVSVKTENGTRFFEGALPLKRSTFNIGEGEWRDTTIVADEVQIRFRLPAAK